MKSANFVEMGVFGNRFLKTLLKRRVSGMDSANLLKIGNSRNIMELMILGGVADDTEERISRFSDKSEG